MAVCVRLFPRVHVHVSHVVACLCAHCRKEYATCEREWPSAAERKAQDDIVKSCKKSLKTYARAVERASSKLEKVRGKGDHRSIQRMEKKVQLAVDEHTRTATVLAQTKEAVACRRLWTQDMLAMVVEPAWLATKTEIEDIFEAASMAKFGYPSMIVYMPPTSPSKLSASECASM